MSFDRIFGIICIIFGLFVALFALGNFILRLLIALLGLFLVNFGMRLRGMPPIHISVMRMWSSRYDF